MSKGLEALERLKDRAEHDEYLFRKDTNREKAISFLNEVNNLVNIIEKELKALEIIKEKGLYWDIQWQPYEEENDYRAWDNELYENVKLTQEEYDLLKEVLL